MIVEITRIPGEKTTIQIEFTNNSEQEQVLELSSVLPGVNSTETLIFEPAIVTMQTSMLSSEEIGPIILKPGEDYVTAPLDLDEYYILPSAIQVQIKYLGEHNQTSISDRKQDVLSVESSWISL